MLLSHDKYRMGMSSPTTATPSSSILVFLDNLPTLPQESDWRPGLVGRFSQQVLRWIGERDSHDLSKMHMPLTPIGALYG